ncbi:hypothetical protein RE6C_05000 [Rhodopirellula europaea 6C]|uniref:Uncharacterized protein n=1 Tax=Rhodopirellula europaea 6C TaxID=1263867 RepID=M2AYG5_9BACT|nr:hypothetical protein RE6C_05000 [Rhodopirellula europaea 6C]
MGLLRTFNLDQSRPLISPPSSPDANGIMLQSKRLLDRLVVMTIESQQDNSTPLSQRTLEDLALANCCRITCSFSVTMTLAAFAGTTTLPKRMGENGSFRFFSIPS